MNGRNVTKITGKKTDAKNFFKPGSSLKNMLSEIYKLEKSPLPPFTKGGISEGSLYKGGNQ